MYAIAQKYDLTTSLSNCKLSNFKEGGRDIHNIIKVLSAYGNEEMSCKIWALQLLQLLRLACSYERIVANRLAHTEREVQRQTNSETELKKRGERETRRKMK